MSSPDQDCVVLFSGGTDSTCVAGICAEKYRRVHLLTLYEHATRNSPLPTGNVEKLRAKYGNDRFIHTSISTDKLVRRLSYERYLPALFRHGLFLLATPGFSSLSWHLRAIRYCLDHGIHHVHDGMTRELIHLPGHMRLVRDVFTELYREYSIEFSSPVFDWETTPSQVFVDRLIVDRHGFAAAADLQRPARTTGTWLYERGIFPRPNIKGSLFDHRMQHDCYPFIVYNMFAFWLCAPLMSWPTFETKMATLLTEKVRTASEWLKKALAGSANHMALFETEEPIDAA